jgi:protein-tyrosine phosphatase
MILKWLDNRLPDLPRLVIYRSGDSLYDSNNQLKPGGGLREFLGPLGVHKGKADAIAHINLDGLLGVMTTVLIRKAGAQNKWHLARENPPDPGSYQYFDFLEKVTRYLYEDGADKPYYCEEAVVELVANHVTITASSEPKQADREVSNGHQVWAAATHSTGLSEFQVEDTGKCEFVIVFDKHSIGLGARKRNNQEMELCKELGINHHFVPMHDQIEEDVPVYNLDALTKVANIILSTTALVFVHCSASIGRSPVVGMLYHILWAAQPKQPTAKKPRLESAELESADEWVIKNYTSRSGSVDEFKGMLFPGNRFPKKSPTTGALCTVTYPLDLRATVEAAAKSANVGATTMLSYASFADWTI